MKSNVEQLNEPIDVIEQKLYKLSPILLNILLKDNTTKQNLRWATSTYEKNGILYSPQNEMKPDLLINENINLLTPRVSKTSEEQQIRTKEKGEVFTPAWCCNMMNNYLDEDWFGRKDVFNKEIDDGWKTNKKKITFSKELKKTWEDYISDIRMEICCGEGPYLVSRYDVVKGEIIPAEDRIGILDRKLRVINENVDDEESWLEEAEIAYKSTYGYDYQGDNVLIARENLLYTLVDNMVYKFGHQPDLNVLKKFATIISWNIWQMDGLDYTVPYSEREVEEIEIPLFIFEENEAQKEKIPAKIRNWNKGKSFEFKEILGGNSKMKYDYIIGNPPYQSEAKGDNATFFPPVYNFFLDSAFLISKKVLLIHPARFLTNSGNTPKEWNKKMLDDPHYKIIYYEADSSKVFPNTDIKGGVVVSYRDETKDFGAIKVFTAFTELNTILSKVYNDDFESFSEIVVTRTAYRLTDKMHQDHPEARYKEDKNGKNIGQLSKGHDYDMASNIFERVPQIFYDEKPDTENQYVKILGLLNSKRTYKYVRRDYINDVDNFEKYKVIVPQANGSGAIGEVLSTPLIGTPLIGTTETFISIGAFNKESEAEACLKYVKSKFARTMLGILKITQANPPERWFYVPMQDFGSTSDIDWSKSVAEVDQQLYMKYNLSQEEIDFIEMHVKEME